MRYNISMAKTYSILMVDDDKFLLDMHKKKLEDAGNSVEAAVSADEALSKLRSDKTYDVIILDIIMPMVDGIELLEKIRQEKLSPNAAVIMLTNESDQEKINQAKNLGADGYIVKAAKIPSEVAEEVMKIADAKLGEK